MDLSQLDIAEKAEKGSKLQLRHPVTDDPLETEGKPVTITLLGTDSSAYRKAIHALATRRANKRQKHISSEAAERDSIDLLQSVTIGWSGIVENGKPVDFNPENVSRVYSNYRWIREQVDDFVSERANFF